MRRLCTYPGCNVAVDVSEFDRSSPRCNQHPTTHVPKKRYAHHYHQGKQIYNSNQWKKLRRIYADQQPLCEHCLKFDIITPLAVVDHVVEIEDGGEPFDINSLQSLCHSCHNKKTGVERKKRKKKGKSLSDF